MMSIERSGLSAPMSWSDFRGFPPDFYSFSFIFPSKIVILGHFGVFGDFTNAYPVGGSPFNKGGENFLSKMFKKIPNNYLNIICPENNNFMGISKAIFDHIFQVTTVYVLQAIIPTELPGSG